MKKRAKMHRRQQEVLAIERRLHYLTLELHAIHKALDFAGLYKSTSVAYSRPGWSFPPWLTSALAAASYSAGSAYMPPVQWSTPMYMDKYPYVKYR